MIYRTDLNEDGVKDYILAPCNEGEPKSAARMLVYMTSTPSPPEDLEQKSAGDEREVGVSSRPYQALGVAAVAGAFGLIGGVIAASAMIKKLTEGKAYRWIVALDGATGKTIWRLERSKLIMHSVLDSDGTLLFTSADDTVCSINSKTGETNWCTDIGGNPVALISHDDRVFVGADSKRSSETNEEGTYDTDRVMSLSRAEGEIQWKGEAHFKKMSAYGRPLWIHNGKLFVNSEGKAFACLNPESGEEIWKKDYEFWFNVPAVSDEFLYCLGGKNIARIKAGTGEMDWKARVKMPEFVWGGAEQLIVSTGNAVRRKGLVYLNAKTGEIAREDAFRARVYVQVDDGNGLIIPTTEAASYVDLPSGEIRWKVARESSSPKLLGGHLVGEYAYLFSKDGVGRYNASSGERSWISEARDPNASALIVTSDRVVFPRGSNALELFYPDGKSAGFSDFDDDYYFFTSLDSYLFASDDGLWCLRPEEDSCLNKTE
jgi:outer membrane protein assembly factor BamB